MSREEWEFSIVSITMLSYEENVGRENINFTSQKSKTLLQLLYNFNTTIFLLFLGHV